MTMKETPVLKAMNLSGPWPNFFFTNPYMCGAMPILLSGISGAVGTLMVYAGHGGVYAPDLVSTVMAGGFFVMLLAFAVLGVVAGQAARDGEEDPFQQRMVLGGLLILITVSIAGAVAWYAMKDWLFTLGPLQ